MNTFKLYTKEVANLNYKADLINKKDIKLCWKRNCFALSTLGNHTRCWYINGEYIIY